jgi:hypothetical protein
VIIGGASPGSSARAVSPRPAAGIKQRACVPG